MSGVREWVRTSVPFSTEAYERIIHRKRRKASRAHVPTLLARSPLKLDLGGGYRSGSNGWINVDTSPQADFYWHLGEPLPFPDDSVDALYSSHLLEHLTFEQTRGLLKECIRVLKPGHEISVCVPNARLFIEHYMGMRKLPDEFFAWEGAHNHTTRIDAVNYIAYLGGEHTYMFDQENLEFILRSAGFEGVRARDFDPSIDLAALRFGLVVSLDPALTGMIASFLAGGLAAVGLGRLIASVGGASTWGVLAWVTAPTVVFVTAPWSEGLFAAFAFWAWYLARKGHWWWAGLLAGGAILTRINGVFLVVGLAAVWWFSQPRKPRNLLPLLIPVVVIGVHFTYLWTLTGRWDEWRAAHEEFWGRQTVDPITAFANSWGLIFEFTPGTISTRFIAEIVGALIIACAVAVLVIKRWWPEAIYVSLTLLSLITSSFYYSIPRSITVLFPIWMLVGVLFVRRPWTRWAYLVAVLPLTLLVVIRFIDGQWIS